MGIAHPCTFSLAIQDAVDVVTHQDKDRRRKTCLSTKTEGKPSIFILMNTYLIRKVLKNLDSLFKPAYLPNRLAGLDSVQSCCTRYVV